METQLELLILLCEEEKIRLQKLIDECLVEKEYLMAHYHSKALYQINGKLHTLNKIDDKLYDEKEFKQRTIEGLQKRIEKESSDYIKEHYEQEIERAKKELEKLNQIPRQVTLPEDSTLLDETLTKLVEKRIKNLKLILNKENNLLLKFTYSSKELKVTLPYIKRHVKKWTLQEYDIKQICKLGFKLADNETKLSLTLTGEKEYILNKLKVILLKIFFEIFHFREFDNDSYIQFTEKSSG
ncbi:MAG TPA: hypothetical protein VF610_06530 [Segetibacter sp.]